MRHEDVRGLEVAVDDAQLVRGVQPLRHLVEDFRDFIDRKCASLLEDLSKRFAFQKFHGDVGRAVVGLGRFVNGDDMGWWMRPVEPPRSESARRKPGASRSLRFSTLSATGRLPI